MHNLTQSQIARREIEQKLIFGELDTSTLYSENKLSHMLSLGRTPVREALQALEQEQMLLVHPRKGVEFLTVSANQQLQLLEVRKELEPMCLKYAVLRSQSSHRIEMLELSTRILSCAENSDEIGLHDTLRSIHQLVSDATGNPYFHHALSRVQSQSRRFWFANKIPADNIVCAQFHSQTMQALALGNAEVAQNHSLHLLEHLTNCALTKLKTALSNW